MKIKNFSDSGSMYLAIIAFWFGIAFYMINKGHNEFHEGRVKNMLYNLTHKEEYFEE